MSPSGRAPSAGRYRSGARPTGSRSTRPMASGSCFRPTARGILTCGRRPLTRESFANSPMMRPTIGIRHSGPAGRLLWSSNRSGNFEIWTAESDGSGARQLSHDGVDAENPAASADGKWIVYGSTRPNEAGIWRMRADGSSASLLAAGLMGIPDISPDSQHVLYLGFTGNLVAPALALFASLTASGWTSTYGPRPSGRRRRISAGRGGCRTDGSPTSFRTTRV